MSEPIYDPLEFVKKVEIFTVAFLGSFITMKLLNAMYENMYEPIIDSITDSEKADKYYLKIGEYYLQTRVIFKEILKWVLLILILMLIYNVLMKMTNKKIKENKTSGSCHDKNKITKYYNIDSIASNEIPPTTTLHYHFDDI